MTRYTHRNAKVTLLGSASAILMAAGAQAAFAAEAEDAAHDDLALVEEAQVQTAQTQQQQQAEDEELELEEIVVTGSRIGRQSEFDTLAPTVAIGEAELDNRAFTNVADALNEIPGFVAGLDPVGGQNGFANGVNFANLFGLGTQRTLTLVDGKRFVSSNPPSIFGPAGGQQVDLNVIPLALIERLDVVGVGGAPAYGSDAIAGTINVIMKDDFEGFELSGQYSAIQRNGGNPESYQAQGTWGANTADGRGNVAMGLEWNKDEGDVSTNFPGLFGAQPFFEEFPNVRDVDGDGEPDDIFMPLRDARLILVGAPGRPLISPSNLFVPNAPPLIGAGQDIGDALSKFANDDRFLQINENGDLIEFRPGDPVPTDGIFAPAGDDGNGLDLDDFNSGNVRSPVERVTGFFNAHYDVFDWLRAYGQFTFANSEAETLIGQDAHQSFIFPDETAAVAFDIDTPFLKESTRQALIDAGINEPTPLQLALGGSPGINLEPGQFFINRSLNDITDQGRSQTESFTWRFVGGFKGDFEVFNRQWNYDISFNWGQSDVDSNDIGINDGRFFNAIDAIALTQEDIDDLAAELGSMDAAIEELNRISGTDVSGAGDVICRSVLEAARGDLPLRGARNGNAANDVRPNVDGCIPLNLLGTPDADAIEFVQLNQIFQSDINQRVFNLNLNGEVVELPAGWVEFVAGYETRRERGSFNSGEASQIGIGRNSPILDTAGEFSTDEGFFELFVPTVSSDMNFGEKLLGFTVIDSLTLEGSARVVDNSLTGRDTVWTGGGRLAFGEFLSDLTIRGNFTQSTRSPSIQELFSPRTDTFSFADDPCDFRFIAEGPAPENRMANCAAIGLDPDFISLVVNATAQGRTGGNPDLGVERADAWTVGGILTPRWLPGFTLAVDFIQVNISNRITTLTLTQQLEACFDQDPGSFDPNEGICATFERDAEGQIVDFSTGFQNAASSRFKALQFEQTYDFSLTDAVEAIIPSWGRFDWGTVSIRNRAFHRILNEFSVIGEEADRTIGNFGEPKWNGTFDFNWNRGPISFNWRVEWQDSADLDPDGDNFFEDFDGNVIDDTSARIINNATASYTFFNNITAQVTVDNIFNHEASDIQIAAGDFGVDEIFGRQYRFRLTSRF